MQTADGLAMYTQALTLPLSWVHGALAHGLAPTSAVHLLVALDSTSAGALLITGVGAALLGRCYAQCYKLASATAVTIAGNVNKAVAVLTSALLLGHRITPVQLVGLGACLGGGFAYSLLRQRQGAPTPTEPTDASADTSANSSAGVTDVTDKTRAAGATAGVRDDSYGMLDDRVTKAALTKAARRRPPRPGLKAGNEKGARRVSSPGRSPGRSPSASAPRGRAAASPAAAARARRQ